MAKKFEIVRLGDTNTDSATSTAIKVGGVLVGCTVLFFGVRAVVKKIHANKGARQLTVDKNALSYDKAWYTNAANSLKTAFNAIMTFDSETIESIILQLKNVNDWNYLQKCFGSYDGKGLPALVNSMVFRHDNCVNHIKQIGGGI
ncbi:MAG: hypothetical protein II956_15995 [Bacteroidales bacterium]|nr:hypothetical protein [Bacteroidales bacterium]